MPSFRRRAKTLEQLREEVLLGFGPEARIVEATRVTRRGVGRFLASEEIEATVVVPDDAAPAGGVAPERLDRGGILSLLAEADQGDGRGPAGASGSPGASAAAHAGPAAGGQTGASAGDDFGDLLARLQHALGDVPPPAPSAIPLPASPSRAGAGVPPADAAGLIALAPAAGDLVAVVGLGDDAERLVRGLTATAQRRYLRLDGPGGAGASGDVVDEASGAASRRSPVGGDPAAARRRALEARMAAVESDRAVLVTGSAAALDDDFGWLAELRPDEVWAAVDAGRTADDSAQWLRRLAQQVGLHAIGVVGVGLTRDPSWVGGLGLRVGWVEPVPRRA
ncbi:hypothetical protein ABIQ69_01015 [Agromyces sp. G08B096]|uniref:Uncharacterized protein n=1 Tax=Agromyces sp. G08B096 TaxID=3156399 RepID=A0AAU7W9D4_9MICO